MELTESDLRVVLGWASAVDAGAWGLHADEKRLVERIRSVAYPAPEPEPEPTVTVEITAAEARMLEEMRNTVDTVETTW